jgi:hypothetical protein
VAAVLDSRQRCHVNRPDFDGDSSGWDSRGQVGRALLTVGRRFVLRRRHVPAGRVEAPMVPPHSTQAAVTSSTWSAVRHGPYQRISSAL